MKGQRGGQGPGARGQGPGARDCPPGHSGQRLGAGGQGPGATDCAPGRDQAPGRRIGLALGIFGLALLLGGCERYADFSLPPLAGGNPRVGFTFEELPGPVLERGAMPDALAPSVVPTHELYYSEWDGRVWHTAHATAQDGNHWLKQGRLLSPDPSTWEGSYIAGNGAALISGGRPWYWYVAGPRDRPRIGLARDWRKEPRPVLEPGPYMSWDEYGVADPYVIQIGSTYYMYFLGEDRAWRQRLGVARSSDGVHWQKLRTNPILELGAPGSFDENGLGEPAVWSAAGFYWMLYTGRGAGEARKLGMARSTDGVHWTKLDPVFGGTREWDSQVICDPTVEVLDEKTVGVWFGGGDIRSPDENLHGQIGYGVLRMEAK